MSETEFTAAVQRAAKALWQHEYDFDPASGITERDAPGFARAALTAALSDVDGIARAIQAAEKARDETLRDWADVPEWSRESYRNDARAIVAHLLGTGAGA